MEKITKVIDAGSKINWLILNLLLVLIGYPGHCKAGTTYSLIIGLSRIDDTKYWNKHAVSYGAEAISGAHLDIRKITFYCEQNRHRTTTLFNENATRQKILDTIESIGRNIRQDDHFLFYYTGHGDRIDDDSQDEVSGKDQVLVAFDDYVVDDEIYTLMRKYFTKSRNIMIVDACHSSTVFKVTNLFMDFKKRVNTTPALTREDPVEIQRIPVFNCNLGNLAVINEPFNLIYFGATPDDQFATGGRHGGTMTILLDQIISPAITSGSIIQYTYRRLACELANEMARKNLYLQYHEIGLNVRNYVNEIPFK